VAATLLALLVSACGQAPDPVGQDTDGLQSLVSADRFRDHMTVLADDRMQGRETGTEGYRLAAEYVAGQFAEIGLVPLGDGGSYFQHVPFLSTRLDPGTASLELRRDRQALVLEFGEQFVMSGGFGSNSDFITAPLVFVGYGIQALQHGHDDFDNVDVSGNILVRLTGAPADFPIDERAYYSSGRVKNMFAVERGAVGVITVRTPVDLPRLKWERYTSAIGTGELRWIGPDDQPFEAVSELGGEVVLSEAGASELFVFAGYDLEGLFAQLDAGGTGSFELGVEATMKRSSVQDRLSAPNVIGMIPGGEEVLGTEYLLFTAHLDHLGVRPADGGNEIHNGAYDNAAGVATILEVARIMAGDSKLPGRSVVFAALTGEEQGLQGSSYLANNLPFPIQDMVAVINIDMPFLGFPIAEIMGLGAEHSSLRDALMKAAKKAGLDYVPDPRPELVRLIRSDQFSFVLRGVPGFNLKPGVRSSDPSLDGPAMHAAFLADSYHQPADNLELPYSAEGAERFASVALLLGLELANVDRRPAWNAGDFFGEKFAEEERACPPDAGPQYGHWWSFR
jgi:hypothetical protein